MLWDLVRQRPDVIHVSSPGLLVFAATLYAKALRVPLVHSYHTHVRAERVTAGLRVWVYGCNGRGYLRLHSPALGLVELLNIEICANYIYVLYG